MRPFTSGLDSWQDPPMKLYLDSYWRTRLHDWALGFFIGALLLRLVTGHWFTL